MTYLPDDYPHEKAIYIADEWVELLGATLTTVETNNCGTVTTHDVYYSIYTQGEPFRGVRTERLRNIRAEGGLSTVKETLLSLPERRVEGRELLE